jgi:hypothetical protein
MDIAAAYEADPDHEEKEPIWDQFEDFLYTRFGLIGNTSALAAAAGDVRNVCKVFGFSALGRLARECQQPTIALLQYFISAQDQAAPERDIDDTASMKMVIETSNVVVTPSHDEAERSICYALRGSADQPNDPEWTIVVRDPVSALQCLRTSCGPRSANIVLFLLSHGIPFNTFLPTTSRVEPSKPADIQLGWRDSSYQPDQYEYLAYEAKRDEFLDSHRGRAALLTGGIVWRLAIDAQAEDCVLDGPSPDAAAYGSRHQSKLLGDACDDKLTPEELDLICGVYRVYTQATRSQTADMSWWPKHSTWLKSGLNWGAWTPNDEHWYQERLKKIRAGTATALSATSWSSGRLKMHKDTRRVVAANGRDAAKFFTLE